MSQPSASAALMAQSTAARLRTGSAPGMPRQTGHTCEFGGAPNDVPHPQKILVRVCSCAWISRPMTGSNVTLSALPSLRSCVCLALASLGLHLRAGGLDRRVHILLEGLEVLDEHAAELLRLLVVRVLVGPRAARIEDAVRHARARHRNVEIEDVVLLVLHVVELPAERRGDHCACVRDLHARADARRTAGPSSVDQPYARVVFRDPLAEHLRVDIRIERQERRAETGTE